MVIIFCSLFLALTVTVANAQNNQSSAYVSGLIETLNKANLTHLATSIGGIVNTTGAGSQLLSRLSNLSQNFTLFAPNNDSCKSTIFASSSTPRFDSHVSVKSSPCRVIVASLTPPMM